MGMDVYGRKASTDTGHYFRNNIWWWHPLWTYCCEVWPELTVKVPGGHYNDGDGLDADDAQELARRLEAEVTNGRTKIYEELYTKLREVKPTGFHFSVENVKEFIAFLKDSGGFEIC